MKSFDGDNFACPIDGQILLKHGQALSCENGHNFDISSKGYLNLLLVQHKSSRDPGDSKEMVLARKRFLETGLFEPIALAISQLAEELLNKPGLSTIRVLDAGCGEGYYLRFLQKQIKSWFNVNQAILIGLDISKWAVQAAAAADKGSINWVVASNYRPPMMPESLDLIVCAFGFPCFEEFHRILKPGGRVILIDPGPNHLIEMRSLIYNELTNLDKAPTNAGNTPGFQNQETRTFSYQTEVSGVESIQDLLMMTPHYFRCSKEGKTKLTERARLPITVELNQIVLVKQ